MLNKSNAPITKMWPSWLTPLLSSVSTYLSRVIVVAVIVPCALPLGFLFIGNLGSITATTQAVLEMAAGSGTDPATITLQTCDDEFTRSRHAEHAIHICTHYKAENVAIPDLARRAAPTVRMLYLVVVLITCWIGWARWPLTPFGWYLLERKGLAGEAANANRHGAAQ
ncbi:hypothetical protein WL94_23875 [Burkholderia cepacia]|uniref:hypothetical protein n=1 Tax=Burkholderia cepacia TaxID=292 RepID=UPI00075E07FD|nr:hypothetical protein [Burkholderia cepacia]KWF83470.1 hypothetical protein WL94_23875 [Burkholderia cepacia]